MSLALLAAEQSADQLGAGLLKALNRPAFGMGGPLLEAAGLDIISQPTHVMGISDVIQALPRLVKTFYCLKQTLLKKAPQAIISIDAPDFFLPLHRKLRQGGYKGKLIHLVSPSVWAWRKNRTLSMAKTLDLLITLLPFEAKHYQHTPLPVTSITHPLAFEILSQEHQPLTFSDARPVLALFPGSRIGEIKRNLPKQLKAAEQFPSHQVVICAARESLLPFFPRDINTCLSAERYNLMAAANCAIATSGTICFELALHQVPTVATYALSNLNYFIGNKLFKIHLPWYTLPNLILERALIPEHIDRHLSAKEIASSMQKLLDQRAQFEALSKRFCEVFPVTDSPYQQAAALCLQHL